MQNVYFKYIKDIARGVNDFSESHIGTSHFRVTVKVQFASSISDDVNLLSQKNPDDRWKLGPRGQLFPMVHPGMTSHAQRGGFYLSEHKSTVYALSKEIWAE